MATAYHVNLTAHSRSKGHSAVAGAAYRAGVELTDERTGEVHDYTRKNGIEHSEIVLPTSAPEWARDRSALWNAAEAAEKRSNSTIDREFKVSFPAQLSFEERREMVRAFSREIVDRHSVAVDFSMHEPDSRGDDRNYHAHVMLSTRRIGETGFGEKAREMDSFSTREEHLVHWRGRWAEISGSALEKAGHKEDAARWRSGHLALGKQVESAAERGDWQFVRENADRAPTIHLGPHATELERQGVETRLGDINRENEAAQKLALAEREAIARQIENDPSILLDKITDRKAVFDRRDIARELHLHIDNPEKFQNIMTRIEASEKLVTLAPGRTKNGRVTSTKYSTPEMIDIEQELVMRAENMATRSSHPVNPEYVRAALGKRPTMTDEQRAMVERITSDRQFALVVGDAGTGKSFSMGAAREVWERSGYRVRGMALSGQAAEQLQSSSGIESRTIASLERRWGRDIDRPTSRDILVVDEAGMVGSKQLNRVLSVADAAGAKIVWVGDHKQLEAIEAGPGFRTVAERIETAELIKVIRQNHDWSRQASYELARGDFRQGLDAYNERGHIRMFTTRDDARQALISDYMKARHELGTQAIMAHANKDVRELNRAVRDELKKAGELGDGWQIATARGEREFAEGDRLVFLKNDNSLDVKNGTLGTVERGEGEGIRVHLDSGRMVDFDPRAYNHIDHGYALTIHKEQGASVDRAYALATPGMDRSLSYVGMTRHKDEATLYAGRDDFRDYERLADRLGRQQIKESTLDYTQAAQGPTRAEEAARGDAADRAYEQELRERVQPEKTLQEVREQSEHSLQSEHAERTLQQARELSAQGVQVERAEQALQQARELPELGVQVERAEQTLQQARELSERTFQGEQAEQTLQQVDELRELQAKAKAAGDEDAGKRTLQELRELSERNFEKPTSEADRAYVQEVHGRVQPERTLREADELRELQAKAKAAGDEHAATRTLSELREQNLQQAAPAAVDQREQPQAIEGREAVQPAGQQPRSALDEAMARHREQRQAEAQAEGKETAQQPRSALDEAMARHREQRQAEAQAEGKETAQQPRSALDEAMARHLEQRAQAEAAGGKDAVAQALEKAREQRDAGENMSAEQGQDGPEIEPPAPEPDRGHEMGD